MIYSKIEPVSKMYMKLPLVAIMGQTRYYIKEYHT
ncbi:Uncharacterised protein [Staphylococcus simulans]|nr:Uncharacterised protein [Staphylococcus simulans]